MVCTTITITAPAPVIKVNSVGFTVNDESPSMCTVEAVGTIFGLILNVTANRAASCKVAVNYTSTVTGTHTVYVPLQLPAGTNN